jgi:hypothetical protein
MKVLKLLLLGAVIGIAIGLWLGVNIGREEPLLANPFSHHESVGEKLKRVSGETLEKGGRALEKTGQDLQDKVSK